MLIHWIWLATRPGLSDRGRAVMLQQFRDAEDIYYADADAFREMDQEAVQSLQDKDLSQAQQILDTCGRLKIQLLTIRDAAYPARLRNIPDPPVVLYYKGMLPQCDSLPLISVVGTRKASAYGLTVAKRMGYQLSCCGGVVVSGMAYGIDGMAMRGALTAGAPVIGVLGCGVDVVYPLSNRHLFADVERSGCLLSEFPPGTPPVKWNFPKRNRIISGLCCGVLVVEAPEKSGALITARLAADQGRDVFVVPGNIDVASCAGSNALLRDGAIAVSSGWDILSEYQAQFPQAIHPARMTASQQAYADEVEQAAQEAEPYRAKVAQQPRLPGQRKKEKKVCDKKEIDNGVASPYSDAETKLPQLSRDEETILALVNQGRTLVDDLIAESTLPAGAVLAALTMLEIKGIVLRLPGKRVQRK